ncbi:HD-GYP domain-containing protein [Clostridium intestinale]|uniref:HD-GYP domain, c-di-GMP phosphodiesterase class II (Or its inactivated variant) n=1 Tax=Clostridium intestinale DSM 6191 TaxID=1121320 RepID=A0A1M5XGQ0_9CLOT|nr:HD-GYP domain-containing protein [Clostridium intestinale]SHH98708.1 HD-GYP domain, c-di-GMP phosphodiesterase class II (or its inactivated variant) [Clostridium intestinale DSM 6191]
MITLYEPIKNLHTVEDEVDKCVGELCSILGYDVATIIKFSDKNSIAISKRTLMRKGAEYVSLNKDWINIIEESSKTILSLVKKKKQIIIYDKDDKNEDYVPLTPRTFAEIYIPIFSEDGVNKELIACIYLALITKVNTITITDLIDSKISDVIYKLHRLYQVIYLKWKRNEAILNLVNMMSEVIREKEPFILLHPYHVAQLSTEIAKKLKLKNEIIKRIYISSVLHDVGKIYLDKDVLNKEDKLSEEEYNNLKQHSIYGANIVSGVAGLNEEAIIVRYHHERYDGKGYPNGLRGEDIPLESRIICVADSVDAMLSHRSFRTAKTIDFVITELLRNKKKQFDPKIVDIMIEILLKTKEESENILSDAIVWSTLIINTEKKVYSIEGTIGKYNSLFFFKAEKFNFISQVDKSTVKSISIYINKNNKIVQYQVKSNYYEENIIHISDFKSVPFTEYFSVLWDLEGQIFIEKNIKFDVNIYKLGGSSLTFSMDEDRFSRHIEDKIISIKIRFENGDNIVVSGKIAKNFKVMKKYYYEFLYVNIPETIKDKIFNQIFRRQLQLKNLINRSDY